VRRAPENGPLHFRAAALVPAANTTSFSAAGCPKTGERCTQPQPELKFQSTAIVKAELRRSFTRLKDERVFRDVALELQGSDINVQACGFESFGMTAGW